MASSTVTSLRSVLCEHTDGWGWRKSSCGKAVSSVETVALLVRLLTLAERAMYETYNAVYVSLHVRVSNVAALALYRDTLGFKVVGTEAKYYADGEDAFSMRMDLDYLREEALDAESSDGDDTIGQDEGGEVGSAGKAGDVAAGTKKKKEKKRKVKVGRQLGVGELVERNESTAQEQTNGTL